MGLSECFANAAPLWKRKGHLLGGDSAGTAFNCEETVDKWRKKERGERERERLGCVSYIYIYKEFINACIYIYIYLFFSIFLKNFKDEAEKSWARYW